MSRSYPRDGGMFFGERRSILPVSEIVADVARRIWPIKTAENLSTRAHTTKRAAQWWLSKQSGMDADSLANLLRSDGGRAILEAIMGDAMPSWWPAFKTDLALADLERRQAENHAAIEELRREQTARRAR